MKRSNRLMLVLGVGLAIVAFGAVLAFGSTPVQSQPVEPPMVAVVTAAADIALGSAVAPEAVTTVQRPVTEANDTFDTEDEVIGQVVRRAVTAGNAFTDDDFAPASSTDSAAVIEALEAGQRAIAVPLDDTSGVGRLLQPGDSVDVLISVTDSDGKFPVVIENPALTTDPAADPIRELDDLLNNTSVKVLVQNVQVLGVMEPPPSQDNDNVVDPVTGLPVAGRMVAVLSVTPAEAELVRFAQLDGNISLLLRAPEDREAAEVTTPGVTLRTLVDEHGVLPPRAIFTQFP